MSNETHCELVQKKCMIFFNFVTLQKKINKAIFCFGCWALGCTKKTKKIKKLHLGKLGALRKNKFLKIYIFREFLVLKAKCLCNFWPFFFLKKQWKSLGTWFRKVWTRVWSKTGSLYIFFFEVGWKYYWACAFL